VSHIQRRTVAALVLAISALNPVAAAELAANGTDLGRQPATEIMNGLRIAIDATLVDRDTDFLIARSQDNRPLMRAVDGTWQAWNGNPLELVDCGCRYGGAEAIYDLGIGPPSELSLPVTLTFGSRIGENVRYGYIVVDGP